MKTMIAIRNISYCTFNAEAISDVNIKVSDLNDELCFATFEDAKPFSKIKTAVFSANEIDSFSDGVIITNTIKNAGSILESANNSRKVLYLYDLDWMFETMLYDSIYSILNNNDLVLITRSKHYIEPIKRLSNREPDAIIEKFDLEKIWNLL
jgi:hypothetical protein